MSLPLTLGLSIPSSIHNRKASTIFSVSNSWRSKCAAASKKIDHNENTRLSLQPYGRQALEYLVTNFSKLSGETDVSPDRGSKEDDMRTKFEEVYSVLKSELLNDPGFEWTHDSRLWVQQMLDYNVPKGKFGRGLYVINSYKLLKEGEELSEDEVFDAIVVAWCIKWIEASTIILDDVMDDSQTRRDQPCWFRVPKVGNIAINDAVLLKAHVPRILKKHFGENVNLLDLFNEVFFLIISGQMLDSITPAGEKDLSNYTLHSFRHTAQYKAGYFLYYFPTACAFLMAGVNLENHVNMKHVLLEMGIHFQIMNDYLDCFGNPEKTGKIGTDIESFKCTWLVVKALELANEEQKKILHEHYGKTNPCDVAKVKGVYNYINLQEVYAVYESENYAKITSCVEAQQNKALKGIWESFSSYRQLLIVYDKC